MLVMQVLLVAALASDCGVRLTVAPLMTPQWLPQLPYGGSIRLDTTVYCPDQRGASAALTLDLGAVPLWVYHTGWFPTFRQQVGLQIEPAARGEVPGGPYITMRVGLSEILYDRVYLSVQPAVVFGYRYEASSGFTAQFGGGVEAWAPAWIAPVWPVVELRAGMMLGRPGGTAHH